MPKVIIFILVILFLIFAFVYLPRPDYSAIQNQSQTIKQLNSKEVGTKFYSSKTFKISFQVPAKAAIKEDVAEIRIELNKNLIVVTRNGTNFQNLIDYLKEFDSRRQIKADYEKAEKIGENEAIFRTIISDNKKRRSVFIYSNYYVYIFSTDSEALFPDLDRIAKSFRYTP